jgi:carbamoyl-phosphate synthase large subunit
MVRPSYVLGGRAMEIVYSDADVHRYINTAVEVDPERPVLVDKYLDRADELDVDALAGGCEGRGPRSHRVILGQAGCHFHCLQDCSLDTLTSPARAFPLCVQTRMGTSLFAVSCR